MSDRGSSEIFLNTLDNQNCIICYNDIEEQDLCITECQHKYCKICLNTWLHRGNISCPFCRQDINFYMNDNEKNNIIKVIDRRNRNNNNNNNNNVNLILNQENALTMVRRLWCIRYIKLIIFINFLYTIYLQYENYNIYISYVLLYNNCTGN